MGKSVEVSESSLQLRAVVRSMEKHELLSSSEPHPEKHYSDIVSDIPSGSICGIYGYMAFVYIYIYILTFFLAYTLTFYLKSWHIFWPSFWHSIWHPFWHSFWRLYILLYSGILSGMCLGPGVLHSILGSRYGAPLHQGLAIWSSGPGVHLEFAIWLTTIETHKGREEAEMRTRRSSRWKKKKRRSCTFAKI